MVPGVLDAPNGGSRPLRQARRGQIRRDKARGSGRKARIGASGVSQTRLSRCSSHRSTPPGPCQGRPAANRDSERVFCPLARVHYSIGTM